MGLDSGGGGWRTGDGVAGPDLKSGAGGERTWASVHASAPPPIILDEQLASESITTNMIPFLNLELNSEALNFIFFCCKRSAVKSFGKLNVPSTSTAWTTEDNSLLLPYFTLLV